MAAVLAEEWQSLHPGNTWKVKKSFFLSNFERYEPLPSLPADSNEEKVIQLWQVAHDGELMHSARL